MIDDLRTQHPRLGFALYALEPGGVVTLELLDEDGNVFTFRGKTAQQVLLTAFPPLPPPDPEPTPASIFD